MDFSTFNLSSPFSLPLSPSSNTFLMYYIKITFYDSWECTVDAKPSEAPVASPSDFPNPASQTYLGVYSVFGLFTLAQSHGSAPLQSPFLPPERYSPYLCICIVMCVCIHVWCGRYTCHSLLEVRGQLWGISSLLPPLRGFQKSNSVPGLCNKYLTHSVIFPALRVIFINTSDWATSSALPKILQTPYSLCCSTLCVNVSRKDSIYCTRTWYSLPGTLSELLAQHVITRLLWGGLFLPGLLLCL